MIRLEEGSLCDRTSSGWECGVAFLQNFQWRPSLEVELGMLACSSQRSTQEQFANCRDTDCASLVLLECRARPSLGPK